jgi:class 3 adenylate cyclase/DNA-binding transcriptional MerR regulator
MLTSREVLRRTGISRATLNNYIALGILPRPLVGGPEPGSGNVRRIGYFEDYVIERIGDVQRLKREGLTMSDIAGRFARPGAGAEQPARAPAVNGGEPHPAVTYLPRPAPAPTSPPPGPAATARETPRVVMPGRPLRLTIDDLPHPAYMVSNNFELEWWNTEAANEIFHRRQGLDPESEARNVFRLLLDSQAAFADAEWREALRLHIGVAKNRMAAANFVRLVPAIGIERVELLNRLYAETEPIAKRHIVQAAVRLHDPRGKLVAYDVFASFFREGVLFAYLPRGESADSLIEFLARREQVIRDLLRRQLPVLTHLAVLVADLDGSAGFATELPPEEYFQLVNDVWSATEPVFRSYYGTHGKHRGDGLVYFFLPQPDCNYVKNAADCACELREAMRRLSRDWQLKRAGIGELRLNIGLNEGYEWFGSFHGASSVDFTVLGGTVDLARDLAVLARDGAINATRRMINVLDAEARKALRYGVRRRDAAGNDIVVPSTFVRVEDWIDLDAPASQRFAGIRSLAFAEITDVVRRSPQ